MARVLIVDGYNVLGSSRRYREVSERDVDSARARLVNDVAAFSGPGTPAIVVFDAADNPASDGTPHEAAGVTVIFSPYGREADEVIERLIAAHRDEGDEVTVVTSDSETQWVALGLKASRMSAGEFVSAVETLAEETDRERIGRRDRRVPIEARLDPVVREALRRWARGER